MEEFLDKVPPDFSMAKKHGEAMRIKNFYSEKEAQDTDEAEKLICECCGMPTFAAIPKYGLCTSTKKLDALGSGFPMFYTFK